jgi:hypothetical protein
LEFLAYLGAALAVVVAVMAYRYWRSTAPYALRVRESHARRMRESRLAASASEADESVVSDRALLGPVFRLIEDLESSSSPSHPPEPPGSVAGMLNDLNEQLAALPSGIELMDLPIVERRKVADRREKLLSDRARLLRQKKRGAHRRSRHRDADQPE